MMAQPAILQPQDPFVLIFFSGGSDSEPHYGFVTDGLMSESDWTTVLKHVGYLSPYSVFKLNNSRTWAAYGQDVALHAAQSIGRPTGGGVMGLPEDRFQWHVLKKAYNEAISLRMTHFFNDDESDLGTSGGNGRYRIEFLPSAFASTLSTLPSKDFSLDPPEGQSLTISFGTCVDSYAFGGGTVILSDRRDNDFSSRGKGWYIAFQNVGGSSGKNYVRFYSDGVAHVSSPAFSYNQALLWNRIHVSIRDASNSGFIKATITVDGVGSSTKVLPKPTTTGNRIILGNPDGEKRTVYYDNLDIVMHGQGQIHVLARYTFELSGNSDSPTGAIGQVNDVSGNGHNLHLNASISTNARYAPTSGIDDVTFRIMQRACINELLEARRKHGFPPPRLLTNWRLSDRPGRFAAWKLAGFTNGSTEYYLHLPRNLAYRTDKIAYILNNDSKRTHWAEADGSRWNQVWLGQVDNSEATLTPDQYQSLVVMAVLDGNRWFTLFTAMSDGHLASHDATRRNKAITNANALYKMAEAASWFQVTSGSLHKSVYFPCDFLTSNLKSSILRARLNPTTKELWFAGYRTSSSNKNTSEKLQISLSSSKGVVINLATGQKTIISHGIFSLPVNDHAIPYYFRPINAS